MSHWGWGTTRDVAVKPGATFGVWEVVEAIPHNGKANPYVIVRCSAGHIHAMKKPSLYKEKKNARCPLCRAMDEIRDLKIRLQEARKTSNGTPRNATCKIATGRTLQEWADQYGVTRQAISLRIQRSGSPHPEGTQP